MFHLPPANPAYVVSPPRVDCVRIGGVTRTIVTLDGGKSSEMAHLHLMLGKPRTLR